MKKKTSAIALALVLGLGLTACGGGDKPANNGAENNTKNGAPVNNTVENTGETTPVTEDVKVGFVTDEGGINDRSFNQGVWEGLQKAEKDFGVGISYQESKEAKDYAPNLDTLLDDENNLIVAAGFNLADAVLEAAEANPDTKYVIIDSAFEDTPDNLIGVTFKAQEPSFLVGYIAGMTTESNEVGFVGGQESVLIQEFEYGYRAGVEYAAKELGKEIKVTTQYVGNFSDAAKGKSIASNMYQQGCDIIFHAAGGAGDGVIEAAQDLDKWAIGVDRDQNDQAPNNVLTSAMKRADNAVYQIVKDFSEGKFQGGETISYGLADGDFVGIAPTSDKNVKPEVLEKVDEVTEKIKSEEIVVPNNEETYKTFVSEL